MPKPVRRVVLLGSLACLVAAACGGGQGAGDASDTSLVPATTDQTASETSAATPDSTPDTPSTSVSSAVADLAGVRDAVVQVVAVGTFVDPSDGVYANAAGSGSGFLIDASGLAVTNNHVVTGAALLEVYVAGDAEPRNARVVAVSECSDLAVIDIEGDGFDYLEWHDGEVAVGMDIFVAGFPLGDAEYTVLDGIVSKERADGEATWSSVDAVIEHSADTLPGSSGGPVVTADGKVVGVNYAGNEVGQSYAIGADVARPVVAQLVAGIDVNSLGLNGEAFSDGEFSGVWVYSVESGSPADAAGVRGGDLVISLEGLLLATDGTMADYCDILRSNNADATMSIEVYRPDTGELLTGQINGRPLASDAITPSPTAPPTVPPTVPPTAPPTVPPTAPPTAPPPTPLPTTPPPAAVVIGAPDADGIITVSIDGGQLNPLFSSFEEGDDPFYLIHTQQDDVFVGVELYTVFGSAWTGELGTFPTDCTTHGICVYLDPDGTGPLVGGGPGTGSVTITRLEGGVILTIDDVIIPSTDGQLYRLSGVTLTG